VDVLLAAAEGALPRSTVSVVGGEELLLSEAVRRIAARVHRPVAILPAPVWAIRALAAVTEWTMVVPLIARAQARMLAEGVSEPAPPCDELPAALRPSRPFDAASIDAALPAPGPFGWRDLLVSAR
jgi:hypothetical protein